MFMMKLQTGSLIFSSLVFICLSPILVYDSLMLTCSCVYRRNVKVTKLVIVSCAFERKVLVSITSRNYYVNCVLHM